jgi:hypothetical protein
MARPPEEPSPRPQPPLVLMALAVLLALILLGSWLLLSNSGDPARPLIEQQAEQER